LFDITFVSKNTQELDISLLVPGDIVYLSSGDMIPSDLLIINAKDFFVNESSLTGETVPVEKYPHDYLNETLQPINDEETDHNVFNLKNVCFMGTNVSSGTAIGIVIQTGKKTYFGTIAEAILSKRDPNNFEKGIKKLINIIVIIVLAMAILVFLIR
jgi:Mg2+-importing ATPase